MSVTPFHPIIEGWFQEKFGRPTDPQRVGWPAIAAGRHTLIAAPTGSGKTLAAFLVCIDRLLRQALDRTLEDQIQVVYVSPLKALSNDIQRNLEAPLGEIAAAALNAGQLIPPIRTLVRTGDTPMHQRTAMLKKPPHILVTTPESLYLLLTAAKSRKLLSGVRTVIVDEIHALARDKRGSHLTLSLERLEALCPQPPVRVGLSATQKPIDEIARFLVGTRRVSPTGETDCQIVDTGHARQIDLAVEVPASEIAAVCSNEQWEEIYKKIGELINSHRSTLIFVNTRRMAERVSYRLREHLGEDAVASHHGSLSRETRLKAEERLKAGELKAIVATASLELGIDIGFIDLVCQIGSPRSIATFLQRVGRSGHHLGVIPKGRLFALTRDELMESLAILRAVRAGRLDRVEIPVAPLDILSQQIVAEVAAQDWNENALYKLCCGAWPFRNLERKEFNRILQMLSEGIGRGRREGAYLHRDQIHHELKARRAARLTAITSGGAIPENAEYRVVTEDEGTFVGTVNEDFAIESLSGDVFLLGNTSWRVRYVRGGQMVVRDAEGAPANVPFWLGEAPGRTSELSEELSQLREDISNVLDGASPPTPSPDRRGDGISPSPIGRGSDAEGDRGEASVVSWLKKEIGVSDWAAGQAAAYVGAQKAATGCVPTQKEILYERFFDESGGMQLVIHAPFGSRINRAWGLAMRKNFCRTFDFELQAAADDNAINLSLGPQHSFPLEQMFTLLKSATAKDALVQALLAAPMFGVRWRWNVTRALAVLRYRGGKKVPPPLQRFKADDLMSAVFPLQTACFEHRPPEVPIPDHPLIQQTVHDCLHEAMDVDAWLNILREIEAGRIKLVAKDTREPSPFSHAILNANPYAFLDDAPAEERRARAVAVRRTLAPEEMRDLARLDAEAIERVVAEAQPVVRDADELHDTLLSLNALPAKLATVWYHFFNELVAQGRAAEVRRPDQPILMIAVERWPLIKAVLPDAQAVPAPNLPPELDQPVTEEEAGAALVRGRLDISGPVMAQKIADDLGLKLSTVEIALARMEAEGYAMQGRYTARAYKPNAPVEWCERRLLARIHRLTLETARRRIQPVPPETYWLYLAEYHHLLPGGHRAGSLGLREALGQLQGFEMPAGAWEMDILASRVEKYQSEWLDQLSFAGEVVWGRLRPPQKTEEEAPSRGGLTRVVPISLAFREDLGWLLPEGRSEAPHAGVEALSVYNLLKQHGALFMQEMMQLTGFIPTRLEGALSELAALGMVTADGFSALRALGPVRRWEKLRRVHTGMARPTTYNRGGRWTLFPGRVTEKTREERANQWAILLLRRYGVVFRDLLTREGAAPAWWELVSVYRRMEARGEIRGGRFIAGVAGEQYALPEAVEALRRPRDTENSWLVISAVDPLNLAGIVLPGARIPALRGNRLLFHNGRLAATLQAGEAQIVEEVPPESRDKIVRALRLTQLPQLREEILTELSTQVAK